MSPLAYCTLWFVAGILAYPYITSFHFSIPVLLFSISILCHKKRWRYGFILCLSLLSWIGGQQWAQLQDPLQHPKHIAHHDQQLNKESIITFTVQQKRKPSRFGQSYIVEVQQVDRQNFTGLVLLQLEVSSSLTISEKYMTIGKLLPIPSAPNPGGFDFGNYMKKKGVHLQLYGNSSQLTFISKKKSVRGVAQKTREKMLGYVDHLQLRDQSKAVMKALVLGDRSDIDAHLQEEYAKAGAVHLLAISGLHVGVLMIILQSLFGYLIPLHKYRRWLLFLTVTSSLWCYAFLTGLSPSVLRAVTMFSFLSFSNVMHRPGLSMQQLWLSLLFLMLIQPSLVYEVGFQLSYAAVFGILWVMPKSQSLNRSKWVVIQKGLDLLVLGCVAQLSTLPLSLYYFHQFPALFWISNLAIVPSLGLILGGCLIGLAISRWEFIAAYYGRIIDQMLHAMNTLIAYVAKQESFLFTNIPFDAIDAFLLAMIVVLVFFTILKFRLAVVYLLVILSFGFHYSVKHTPFHGDEFIVFHSYKNTLIGIKEGEKVTFLYDESKTMNQKIIDDFTLHRQINKQNFQTFPLGLQLGDNQLLIVDENRFYDFPSLLGSIVIVRNSPKVHLGHLIQRLQPKAIVADGSNFKNYIDQWKKTCKSNGISFYDTSREGAFILNL